MYRHLKWYQKLTLMHGLVAVFGVVISYMLYLVWYEATFDYTKCRPTEQYREQHSSAYTTYMKVGDVVVPQFHPARDWTERLYNCPKGREGSGEQFDKWRTENQP